MGHGPLQQHTMSNTTEEYNEFFNHLFHTILYYKHTQIQHYMITDCHVNFVNLQQKW